MSLLQNCDPFRKKTMSENNHITDEFDLWLTEGLKKPQPLSPEFTQSVVAKMERLAALRMLRKVAWQKRIYGWAVCLVAAGELGALFCPPVLRSVYGGAKHVLGSLALAIAYPSRVDMTALAMTVACLALVGWAIFDRFIPER